MADMKTLADYAALFVSRTVQLPGGQSVHYREANRGAKKTIVVVHGITGTHYSMLQMAGVWAERGAHIIVVDLPGHGKSDRVDARRFRDLADWLYAVIGILVPGNHPITLVGNSFGSAVCFSLIAHHGLPDGSRVVLGAPTPTISRLSSSLERASKLFPEWLLNHGYYRNPLVEFIRMRVLLADINNDHLRSRLRESLRSEAKIVQHKYAMGLLQHMYRDEPYMLPLPDEIHKNIVVVYGDDDKIAGRNVGDVIRQRLPYAQVVEAPLCGHLVHIEAVESLTEAVGL
jgi:pimeloyl-ACP methyl ester carboxylesterase